MYTQMEALVLQSANENAIRQLSGSDQRGRKGFWTLETYRKGDWRCLGASTPCGWDFLGVTVEGDVVVVIGVGVGTTECIGDGAHGLDPIAVV